MVRGKPVPPHSLGAAVKARRIELGLSQQDVADRVADGMTQPDVSALERADVKLPRRPRLERIAAALEMPMSELLARSGWADADQYFAATAEAIAHAGHSPGGSDDRAALNVASPSDATMWAETGHANIRVPTQADVAPTLAAIAARLAGTLTDEQKDLVRTILDAASIVSIKEAREVMGVEAEMAAADDEAVREVAP